MKVIPRQLIRLCCALVLFLFSPLFVHAQQSADDGIFVYTLWNKHSVTHAMSVLFTDSIFVYNGIGIEKVMKSEDLIINNEYSTMNRLHTYYRINFDKRQFQDLGKKLTLVKEEWQPFTSPKTGINFGQKLYNGEEYTESDTIINRKACRVFRFVGNANGTLKDAHVTLIFLKMKDNWVHVLPGLEDPFNGRLLSMEATDDKDGRLVVVLENIQPLSHYWKKVINYELGAPINSGNK